jgi:hypothetical protein
MVQSQPYKVSKIISQKQNKNQKTGDKALVVECLPSKCASLWVQSPILKKKNTRTHTHTQTTYVFHMLYMEKRKFL